MNKTLPFTLCLCIFAFDVNRSIQGQDKAIHTPLSTAAETSNREQDGLSGPVRRVRVETAQIIMKDGKSVEGPRALRSIATYDPKGRKIDSVAYPVEVSTPPGKEQYRYDEKGNIVEMVLRGDDGAALSKETYQYEFDELGNWKKMISSVAVYENDTVGYEPMEVSYRTITYYYLQAVDKLAAPGLNPDAALSATPTTGTPAQTSLSAVATNVTDSSVAVAVPVAKELGSSPETQAKGEAVNSTFSVAAVERESNPAEDGLAMTSVAAMPAVSDNNTETKPAKRKDSPASGISTTPIAVSSATAAIGAPEQTMSLYKKGLAHLAAGRHAEAVEALNQSIRLNPKDAIVYVKLGLAYSGLQQYKEAAAVFKMAARIKREAVDAEAYYRWGYAFSALGKPSDALSAFKQALYITRAEAAFSAAGSAQGSPSMEQLHYSLGLAYHNLAQHRDAITEMKNVIALNPKLAEAYYGLAVAYIAIGDRRSAEKQQQTLRFLNSALADKVAGLLSPPPSLIPNYCRAIVCR